MNEIIIATSTTSWPDVAMTVAPLVGFALIIWAANR